MMCALDITYMENTNYINVTLHHLPLLLLLLLYVHTYVLVCMYSYRISYGNCSSIYFHGVLYCVRYDITHIKYLYLDGT